MMYCSSKKCTLIPNQVFKKYPDIKLEKIKQFLKDECELRNSDIIQNLYDYIREEYNRTEEVEDFVQQIILARHNCHMTTEEYRVFLSYYRDELKNDAFFMKHNIMTDCPIPVGVKLSRKITDLTLFTVDNLEQLKLGNLIDSDKRTIILSSSST